MANTMIASIHSPLAIEASAAKTSSSTSGLRTWLKSTRRRERSRCSCSWLGP
jgi:hypothetical protein